MNIRCHNLLCLILISALVCSCKGSEQAEVSLPALQFRLATELNPASRIWEVSNLFRNEIEKACPELGIAQGEIQVEFYDQGMVGTERQLLENCYFGIFEMVQINSSVVTTIDPTFSLLDLPYLFLSEEHHREVLYGSIGRKFLNRLEDEKLLGLGFYGTGFRNLFYKQGGGRPCIQTPEDLAGMKIRVMESPVMINSINALGATATPIPHSEVFQGLRTGVVDGAENSARIFMSYRYYEAGANCFTLTEHFANQHVLVANMGWLSSLEPKYRDRILSVARSITPEFDRIWAETTRESLEEMGRHNVTVNILNDKQAFIKRGSAYIDEYIKANPELAIDLIDEIRALGSKYFLMGEKRK
jgi:TRAP-type transport system periplasmic protein